MLPRLIFFLLATLLVSASDRDRFFLLSEDGNGGLFIEPSDFTMPGALHEIEVKVTMSANGVNLIENYIGDDTVNVNDQREQEPVGVTPTSTDDRHEPVESFIAYHERMLESGNDTSSKKEMKRLKAIEKRKMKNEQRAKKILHINH